MPRQPKKPEAKKWPAVKTPTHNRLALTHAQFDKAIADIHARGVSYAAARRVLVHGEATRKAAKTYGIRHSNVQGAVKRVIKALDHDAFKCRYCGRMVPRGARCGPDLPDRDPERTPEEWGP